MDRLGITTRRVLGASPFSQLGMTSRRMNAAAIEAKLLGKTDCVCSLALSSRPIALHARIGDTGDTVAAYVPGVAPTTFKPSDLCETPCSSTLADRLVMNLVKLVLAICRTISRIMNTNAPSEEVRVHFTDVGHPYSQFLTCTASWTYASDDEIEELVENREPIESIGCRVRLTCGDTSIILERQGNRWNALGILGCQPFARALLQYFKRHARKFGGSTAPAVKVRCACAISRLNFDGFRGRLDMDNQAHIGSVDFRHEPSYINGPPSSRDQDDVEHVYSKSDAYLTLVMMDH